MTARDQAAPAVRRVMVATDRSQTADKAAHWAADLASTHNAELVLVQVMVPPQGNGASPPDTSQATAELQRFAQELAGQRGRADVVVDSDPAAGVLKAAQEDAPDVLVVGNVGMRGRKQFLLGNLPNRISHNARCTVVIVNTAPDGSEPAPTHLWDEEQGQPPSDTALFGRASRIGGILLKAGFNELTSRSHDQDATRAAARRFRDALDELGPTFAKLGQILSTRPDLLPPDFIEELATLQENVTPLTEAEVVAVMERELGVPWEDVFESIDPEPLAAGTIAQAHRATLETGEKVVIKVQRPTAEHDIMEDLGLFEMFARKAADKPALRQVIDIPAVIEHLSASLRRELDFTQEANNLRRMAEVLAPFPRLGVPTVYDELSSKRLLVMQEIEGGPVSDAPAGEARQEAARQLLEGYYHQVMSAGFFHADPHPGNLKWWNDRIYLLDLGMVGELDPQLRELIILVLLSFSQRDPGFLSQVILMLAAGDEQTQVKDFEGFQRDLDELITRYRDLPISQIQLGPVLQEVTEISVRHNVRLPAALMLTAKAFSQMQLVAIELDPDLDPFSVAESFLFRNTLRHLSQNLDPKKIFYDMQKSRVRLTRVLEAVEGLVGTRPGARLQVDVMGTEHLESTLNTVGQRLSLGFGLASSLIVTALTADSERVPRWVPALTGTIGATLAARLVFDRSSKQ